MNEQEQLLQLLKTTLQEGKDFVLEQAPSVVQEIILWGRAINTFGAVASVLAGIVFSILLVVFIKRFMEAERGYDWCIKDTYCFCMVASGIASVAAVILTLHFTVWSLKVWLCPKLYLLEYLGDLV